MNPKLVSAAILVAVALTVTPAARAHTYQSAEEGHPLRMVAYLLHPLGVAAEYIILRPWHKIVSRDPFAPIFGHDPREAYRFPGWQGRRYRHNEDAYRTLWTNRTTEEVQADRAARTARRETRKSE